VTRLADVDPERSLDLLERLAREERAEDGPGERALAALGYHAGEGAARRLERLATGPDLDSELRKNALFWAGQTRPALGVALADRLLAEERDEELREQALFVLAQAETPEAVARLRRAAEGDRDPETRSRALFWLSQLEHAPAAAAWIFAALAAEADPEVREEGVFALSQAEGGVAYLVRLLRESDRPEVKRQALFWLGQSDDPRALDQLEALLSTR
jgi:HEAT repeat protein